MGRESKFSFPGVSRNVSGGQPPEASGEGLPRPSSASNRHIHTMSKAERLLGTTDLPVRFTSKRDTLDLELLDLESTYLSPSIPERGGIGEDMGASGTDHSYRAPPRHQSLRHHASANAVGGAGVSSPESKRSLVGAEGRHLRAQQSSSTLRSFYDSHVSPLFVSQQSSESTLRDSSSHYGNHTNGYAAQQTSGPTALPGMSREQKPGRRNISKFFSRPRTASAQVQPSRVVSNPPPPQAPASSEHYGRGQPVPHASESAQKPTRTPTVLQKPRPGDAVKPTEKPSPVRAAPAADHLDNPKNNVRRPPPGIQHWFEGLLEEDEEDEEDEDEDEDDDFLDTSEIHDKYDVHDKYDDLDDDVEEEEDYHQHFATPAQAQPTVARSSVGQSTGVRSPESLSEEDNYVPAINFASRYFNVRNPRGTAATANFQQNALGMNPPTPRTPQAPPAEPPAFAILDLGDDSADVGGSDTSEGSRSRSTTISESPQQSLRPTSPPESYSALPTRSEPAGNTAITPTTFSRDVDAASKELASMDQRRRDVLRSRSSTFSDDDVETEDSEIESRLPKVRDSIKISDITADKIHIGKARAFEIIPTHKRSATDPMLINVSGLHPIAGSSSASTPVQRRSASREIDTSGLLPQQARTPPSVSTRLSSSSTSPGSIRERGLFEEQAILQSSGHKLMAVTAEEEALLEMMRSKRSAMVNQSFKEGYQLAMLEEERRKQSRSPSAQTQSMLAALETVINSAGPNERSAAPSEAAFGRLNTHDAGNVDRSSSLTEIIDAFPTPSPTSARFSENSLPRGDDAIGSPGLSAASSSRRGRAKRHSNMSTLSSNVQSTPGTSATCPSPAPAAAGSDADEEGSDEGGSDSGDPSNASTLKGQNPSGGSSPILADSPERSPVEAAPSVRPSSSQGVPAQQAQLESSSFNQDTNSLSSPELIDDVSLIRIESAPARSSAIAAHEAEDELTQLNGIPTPAPASVRGEAASAGSGSARKLLDRRPSKSGTEYRLTPKISQASHDNSTVFSRVVRQANPSAAAQIRPESRSMSVPTIMEGGNNTASSQDARPLSPHRFRLFGGATSPPLSRTPADKVATRAKPRAINIAGVRRVFSVRGEPGPPSATLPEEAAAAVPGGDEVQPRSSVSEDVLNAWSNLGGWKGFNTITGDNTSMTT